MKEKMILFPNNIFARLIQQSLDPKMHSEVKFLPSAMLTAELNKNKDAVALIPTTDLIKNRDLAVSKKIGISFDGKLCNSYIYYKPMEETVRQISLVGDVSTMEAITSKIFFKEVYNSNVEISVAPNEKKIDENHLIIVGDKNFENDRFKKGISFSEEMIDAMEIPYVNYVLAGNNEERLAEAADELKKVTEKVYKKIEDKDLGENVSDESKEYFKENGLSLILLFDDQDVEGINQLLRLPYFYGMIDDIFEIKFV